VPDVARSKAIKGEVVAVGRGKWHPGEWWNVLKFRRDCYGGVLMGGWVREWDWIPGWREVPPVYPGQRVYFNSKWSDTGADYQHPGVGWDQTLHMVQVADIFAVIN
jgi:hypothetical protein